MQETDQNNRRRYPADWDALNRELATLEQRDGNLLAAVDRLREHQLDSGFIRDDLYAVECYNYAHPEDSSRFLSVQYNPTRVNRLKMRVGAIPPGRDDAINEDCFLCMGNIEWQHRGIEKGYAIDLNGVSFNIWMNAYPLMPVHLVVATDEHMPQAWDLGSAGIHQFSIEEIIANLVTMARRLPGYIGFYNGDGAGTSVPAHFHYQFFRRRNGGDRFPLELAPTRQVADLLSEITDYPVDAVRWAGNRHDEIITRAASWIDDWLMSHTHERPSRSANIYAMTDAAGEQLQVYFVPRDKELCHSPRMSGMIGSLEILGELVLTSENEKHDLDQGKIDYSAIARILGDIRVPL